MISGVHTQVLALPGWLSLLPWNRIQFSLKMAAAALLALFFSLLYKLPNPGWAVISAVLLMMPNYLGAVAEKSLLRAIGTIVGGGIGMLILGNFADQMPVVLLLTGGMVAICTYYFGGSRYPYAFFLAALTMTIIVSSGLQDPQNAWEITVHRVQEILTGIVATLLVSSIFWPKFARWDFLTISRETFSLLAELERQVAEEIGANAPSGTYPQRDRVLAALRKMQQLIQLGQRESVYFRAHVGTYARTVASQSLVLQLLLDIGESHSVVGRLPDGCRSALDDFQRALGKFFQLMQASQKSERELPGGKPAEGAIEAGFGRAWEVLEASFEEVVGGGGEKAKLSPEDRLLAAGLFGNYRDLVREMLLLRALFQKMPTPGQLDLRGEKIPPTEIPDVWVLNGIRGGIAFVVALFFCDWVNPPGAGTIPVWAFLFTITTRTFASGTGEIGIFTNFVRTALLGIPFFAFFFVISPVLTDYLFANLIFGLLLFLLGWVAFPFAPGFSPTSFLLLNAVVLVFSLNFQQALTFEQIASTYLGGMLGLLFAAVSQRLLWPVLPQKEFLRTIRCVLEHLSALLAKPASSQDLEAMRPTLTAELNETGKWAGLVPAACLPEEDVTMRQDVLLSLRKFAKTAWLLFAKPGEDLPPEIDSAIRESRRCLSTGCEDLRAAIARGMLPSEFPGIRAALEKLHSHGVDFASAAKEPRDSLLHQTVVMLAVRRETMLCERFLRLHQALARLNLPKYNHDYLL